MNDRHIPGTEALRQWLRVYNMSASAFAKRAGLDDRKGRKIVNGELAHITVEDAARIEHATGGVVHIRLWIPVPV